MIRLERKYRELSGDDTVEHQDVVEFESYEKGCAELSDMFDSGVKVFGMTPAIFEKVNYVDGRKSVALKRKDSLIILQLKTILDEQ